MATIIIADSTATEPFVIQPEFDPEWQWRIQAQILLPTSIFKGSKTPE